MGFTFNKVNFGAVNGSCSNDTDCDGLKCFSCTIPLVLNVPSTTLVATNTQIIMNYTFSKCMLYF